jgi:hypothetical protein
MEIPAPYVADANEDAVYDFKIPNRKFKTKLCPRHETK